MKMHRLAEGRRRLESFCCGVFNILAIVVFAVLLWYGLRLTGQNGGDSEYISFRKDSVIYNVFTVCAALLGLFFLGRLAEKMQGRKVRNVALAIVCVLTAAVSFYWVTVCKAAPQADQMMICQYADAFNMGDFNGVLQGRYIARYPQQLGMVTLLRGLFAIFGPYHYQAFQYLMVAVVPLLVVSGCMIVRILSDDNARVEIFYLLFMLTCFPMYIYTAFVYGDLISTALGMFGVWMYLSYLKKFSWVRLLLFGVSMGVAVQLRANLMILVVAMAIVLLIKLIVDLKWQNIVIVAALVLGVVLADMAVWSFYSEKAEGKAPSIPPLLFIVMGLNDADGHPGWYNAYNYIVFAEHNDDVEVSNAIAREHLKESLSLYWEDPDYMLDFFQRKMNAQWNAPMYQCIAMNRHIEGNQIGKLAPDITNYGRTAQWMESWMKIYQLLMYGSILFLLASRRKEMVRIEKYTLLIAVYGGFLFSLIWEAKTRYVLPFLFLQIPYMALGVSELVTIPQKAREVGIEPFRKVLTGVRATAGRAWRSLRENRRFVVGCVAVLAVHMALVLFFGVQKKGFHEEEYCSYYTSTGDGFVSPYSPVNEKSGYIVQRQFFVAQGNQFHYDVVADAQKKAGHPPLYYLALHTLMSLRPDSFYKWFGIGLNALCSLVSCCGIMLLALRLSRNRYRRALALAAGLVYAVCPGVISSVMFAGTYAMTVMWFVLYLHVFVALVQNLGGAKGKFAGLAAAGGLVCGLWFLTCYFSFAIVLFLVLGGCLWAALGRKGLGRMLRFTGIMLIAAGVAVLAFPSSLRQLSMHSAHRSGGILSPLKVQFLYQDQEDKVAFSRENAKCPAVVIYGYASQEQAWYASNELWPYDCVLYVDYMDGENALVNETLQTAERLIVYMDCPKDMLERIIARNDDLSSFSLVRQEERFCVYVVE